MTLLVTGGLGFVMSNFVLHWLRQHDGERAIVLDRGEPDALARAFFAPVSGRVTFIAADIAQWGVWQSLPPGVTVVAHGAALTPSGEAEEKASARAIVEVNVLGTANALDWARTQDGLRRFLYVSTGGVYVDEDPRGPGLPLPEEGYVDPRPRTLYPITKSASEQLAGRFATLWSMPLAVVRLSSVYGPMDRPTIGRRIRCVPNRLCHLALQGKTIRVDGLQAVGDYVYAPDVASALTLLADAGTLEHRAYNIADGRLVTTEAMLEELRALLPETRWVAARAPDADVTGDPAKVSGKWGAYDVSRLQGLGWQPTALRDCLAHYLDWIRGARTLS